MTDNNDWLDGLDETELVIEGRLTNERKDKSPQYLLPLALLQHTIGMDGVKRLHDAENFCAIVVTPSPDWTLPLMHLLKPWEWDFVKARVTPLRPSQIADDTTSIRTMDALAMGGRVLGIGHDPERLLPSSMRTAADMVVRLPPPNGEVIGAVIRRMFGRTLKTIPNDIATGLEFDEIVACLRPGTSPSQCVERLKKAVASKRSSSPITQGVPAIHDLHGYGAAKEWALNLIEDLEAWRRGEIGFDAIDANVVLASLPGLGKTTFARSLAHTTGLPLIATSVGKWFSESPGYLDSIVKQIDKLFVDAKAAAPAIIFLDEIDAVPNRATISPRGADWWLPVITHLLDKLDGAVNDTTDRLIIVGATNHPEKLDTALVRPGRLDRIIHIAPPTAEDMQGILRQHLGTDLEGEDLTQAGQLAAGASGAMAVSWVKTARRTARSAKRSLQMADLLAAIAPADVRTEVMIEGTALHEAGHAIVADILGIGEVESVSIVIRDDRGGSTMLKFDGFLPTRTAVENLTMQLLAGRAAEQVFLGEPGTGSGGGADSDLARATRYVGMLHAGEGLGETLSFRGESKDIPAVLARDPRLAAIVEAHLQKLYRRTLEMIQANRPRVRAVADELIRTRHIGREQFKAILATVDAKAAKRSEANDR
jgi:cell division protease FtsH